MLDLKRPITFVDLLDLSDRIQVPQIQRDYTPGCDSAKDIREDFLKARHAALVLPQEDAALPLNLDFVYGSLEGKTQKVFLPLDGQQRLTTLFLLHWYLAWKDGVLPELQKLLWDGRHSRFSYVLRPSSKEFFDEIVNFVPEDSPDGVGGVRAVLQKQPWFYLHWRLDPTIQSALTMLDAIHAHFRDNTGLFSRLIDREHPAVTFQLLPLEHFGLSDDLYVKMNARGKPLTAFETFKARFQEHLKSLYPSERREIGGGKCACV